MNEKRVAVIIPYYSNQLSKQEKISWKQMCKVFSEREIYLIVPEGLNVSIPLGHNCRVERFSDKYFIGREGYNSLMLLPMFYEKFIQYEYILICQLDVFIFSDMIDYFCGLGYDYIGAPWLKGIKSYEGNGYRVCYVGNGGLSLRKTKTMKSFLVDNQPERLFWEDYFLASYKDRLNIPSKEDALKFAFEGDIKECLSIAGRWPMGIHGWWRFDFESVKCIIQEQGYDISNIQDEKLDMNPDILDYRALDDEQSKLYKRILSLVPQMSDNIILWGSGYYGDIIGWILKKCGMEQFVYVDKSREKSGTSLHGKKIQMVDDISDDMIIDNTWIICVEKHIKEIFGELKEMGVSEVNIILFTEILNCFEMNKKAINEN